MSDPAYQASPMEPKLAEHNAGALSLDVVMISEVSLLAELALTGRHPHLYLVFNAVMAVEQSLDAPDPADLVVCGACEQSLAKADVAGVAVVMRSAPEIPGQMLAFAVCSRCATTRHQAEQAATDRMAREVPGLRVYKQTQAVAGHA